MRPVSFQVGDSEEGREFAASSADVTNGWTRNCSPRERPVNRYVQDDAAEYSGSTLRDHLSLRPVGTAIPATVR
jgi:hypothetical protein